VAADGFVRDHQDPALVRRVGTWHRPRLRAFLPAGAKPQLTTTAVSATKTPSPTQRPPARLPITIAPK